MCYILTSIRLKRDEVAENAITDLLKEKARYNADGTGYFAFSKDSQENAIKRALKFNYQEAKKNIKDFDIITYHHRFATQGTVSNDNVHLWKWKNWIFCHNGTISGFYDAVKTDSLQFFEEIQQKKLLGSNGKINYKKIVELSEEYGLNGRYEIIDIKGKKIYFFGDFKSYLLNNSYIVFTSMTSSFEGKKYKKAMSMQFSDPQYMEILKNEIEGVFMVDIKKNSSRYLMTKEQIDKHIDNNFYTGKDIEAEEKSKGLTEANKLLNQHSSYLHDHTVGGNLVGFKRVGTIIHTVNKPRTAESYVKEFENRLKKELEKYPTVAEIIEDEEQVGGYDDNIFSLTYTEFVYFDKWIGVQLRLLDEDEKSNLEYEIADIMFKKNQERYNRIMGIEDDTTKDQRAFIH